MQVLRAVHPTAASAHVAVPVLPLENAQAVGGEEVDLVGEEPSVWTEWELSEWKHK